MKNRDKKTLGNDEAKGPQSEERRRFLRTSLVGTAAMAGSGLLPELVDANDEKAHKGAKQVGVFALDDTSISKLQEEMTSGGRTAREVTEWHLQLIQMMDKNGPKLNSIIELNPDALAIADALDKERHEKGPRGPLHGIPMVIKDNIDTADKMMTTAGSLALVGSKPPKNAFVAQKLIDAGVVILGKTNLSEWANIRSSHSTSGWSGRGGLTKNPYALDRNTSGSSSGSAAAVAANLAAAAIGTETDGSIVSPSNNCGLVGFKPTVGLVSRTGIIPISHTQDTAGPMCRFVRDAAIVMGAITGVDPEDKATAASAGKSFTDYTQFLKEDGLKGARIGVARQFFGDSEAGDQVVEKALLALKDAGATLVDPANVDTLQKLFANEFLIFLYELKADLNAYLARLGPNAPVKTLKDLIEFNTHNAEKEMPFFGQDIFLKAQEKGDLTTKEYLDALESNLKLSRQEGIDAVMDKQNLDAIVAPTGGPAWLTDLVDGDHSVGGSSTLAAVAGYPSITVPAGMVFGLPVGLSFIGRAWSEPVLFRLAYAFEQATKARRAPNFLPTVKLEAR